MITRNLQGALMIGISNHVQVNAGSVKKILRRTEKALFHDIQVSCFGLSDFILLSYINQQSISDIDICTPIPQIQLF